MVQLIVGGAEWEVDGVDPFLLELRHYSRQTAPQLSHQVVRTENGRELDFGRFLFINGSFNCSVDIELILILFFGP